MKSTHLPDDPLNFVVVDPDFRRQVQVIVVRQIISRWSQSVPIQNRPHVPTVRKCEQR